LLLVITLLGFFAAMAAPVLFRLDNSGRAKITQQRLQQIRDAILGRTDAADSAGRHIAQGYVADMAHLPDLYLGRFDENALEWSYFEPTGAGIVGRTDPEVYDNDYAACRIIIHKVNPADTTNWAVRFVDPAKLSDPAFMSFDDFQEVLRCLQPIDLWDDDERLELLPPGAWKGPYITRPTDEYPKDTDHFDYSNDPESLRQECRMRRTNNRLADGWGRSFIFWPRCIDGRTDLWVISEGPDRKSAWAEPDDDTPYYHYDQTAPENQDNLVAIIHYSEWYERNVALDIHSTEELLEDVRTALVGPRNCFDEHGRALIGGYVGDLCTLPTLYRYDDASGTWVPGDQGQPRSLWSEQQAADERLPFFEYGYGWRGPYYKRPWGKTPEEQTIKDAWGRDLEFHLVGTDRQDLWIVSRGPDGISDWDAETGTVIEGSDDIYLRLTANEWTLALQYRIDQTQQLLESYRVAIAGTGTTIHRATDEPVIGGLLGDLGRMPCLYEWDSSRGAWLERYRFTGERVVRERWTGSQWATRRYTTPVRVYPRELWTQDPVGDGTSLNDLPPHRMGAGWNGPYIEKPPGSGGSQVPRDAWGRPLIFELTDDGTLRIISEGLDDAISTDDLEVTVSCVGPEKDASDNLWLKMPADKTANAKAMMFYPAGDGISREPKTTPIPPVSKWTPQETGPYSTATILLSNIPPGKRVVVVWDDADGDDEVDEAETIYGSPTVIVDPKQRPDRGDEYNPIPIGF